MKQRRQANKTYIRLSIYAALAVLLILLIVRGHSSLTSALSQARRANGAWLTLGVVAMAASLPATALVYKTLSPRPLMFWRTVVVQTAGFCVNKLLPSGSGAAGVSFLYLRANKVKGVQAGSLVVLNNLLGFAGHFVLFWVLVAAEPSVLRHFNFNNPSLGKAVWLIIASSLIIVACVLLLLRERLARLVKVFRKQIAPLVKDRRRLVGALLASMAITLCYTLALWASAHAVSASISLPMAIIALSSSVLATSAIPSPGGIGAAELGAYGGLLAVGVDSQQALAAALLYRVCTFWLPLIVGSVALVFVSRLGWLAKSAKS